MLRPFLLLFLLMITGLGVRAETNAQNGVMGIIILKSVAGYDALATTFASIEWVNRDGGFIVDSSGAKIPFLNDAIGRVIYFDQAYFDETDHNQYWVEWRLTIRDREAVIQPVTATSLRSDDSPRLAAEQATLEDAVGRYANGHSLVDPMIAELKDQIAKLASGLVLQNGQWISANDAAAAPVAVPTIGDAESKITFTTKDGKRFANARVTITETGLSILTDDGGGAVSFDRLPDNISGFPKTTRDKIADWRIKHPPVVVAAVAPIVPAVAPPAPRPLTLWEWVKKVTYNAASSTWAYAASFGSSSTTSSSTASTTSSATPPTPASTAAPVTPPAATLAATSAVVAVTTLSQPVAAPASGPDLSNTVVLIKGDYSEGTGFLARTSFGPVVITNLHVVAANPNMKILTTDGQEIVPLSMQGASDRDLAMFAIQDNNYKYLDLADNVDQSATVGDAAIIPGNSEGGEVTLKTNGSLVGIGPQRVEFNNPIYHGNSGGPVLDVRTGKVVAVVTGAIEMKPTDDLDRSSFANANSAIKGPMRYFGLRLDTVPNWQTYNQGSFVQETLFLKKFHGESRALDAILNASHHTTASPTGMEGPPSENDYMANESIRKIAHNWINAAEGREKETAYQELVWELGTLASGDLDGIKNPDSFYPFDRDEAKYDLAYRTALIDEIQTVQSRLNRSNSSDSSAPGL
jgi:hypothetical protein